MGCGVWGQTGPVSRGYAVGRPVLPTLSPTAFPSTGRRWAHRGLGPQMSHQEGAPAITHPLGPPLVRCQPEGPALASPTLLLRPARHCCSGFMEPGCRRARQLSAQPTGKGSSGLGRHEAHPCWTLGPAGCL